MKTHKHIMIDKTYCVSLLVLLCTLALPARGQKNLDKTIQKIVSLEKDIESLRKDSSNIKNAIKERLLQIEKDSLTNDELNRNYESLIILTSQDSLATLVQHVDSLEKLHLQLQESIVAIRNDISEKNNMLEKSNADIENMNVYSEIEKQQIYQSNQLYLEQRYSEMSLEKLDDISNSAGEFISFPNYADYQKRIARAIENKHLYDKAWKCICTGENYQNVVALRDELIPLLELKENNADKGLFQLTKEQFNEMDSLDIRLSRYNNGIKELKKIVEEINKNKEIAQLRAEKKSGTERECINMMKPYVIPEKGSEQEKIYLRYFITIPYLQKLLKDYWSELKKNPFDTPTESEKTITSLITR